MWISAYMEADDPEGALSKYKSFSCSSVGLLVVFSAPFRHQWRDGKKDKLYRLSRNKNQVDFVDVENSIISFSGYGECSVIYRVNDFGALMQCLKRKIRQICAMKVHSWADLNLLLIERFDFEYSQMDLLPHWSA